MMAAPLDHVREIRVGPSGAVTSFDTPKWLSLAHQLLVIV
jgi:hypothetical protein